jgi:DNA-binding response OmpR family regulator
MKTKILVVEDDTNIRFGLVELLTSEGFAVEACTRGDVALGRNWDGHDVVVVGGASPANTGTLRIEGCRGRLSP